MTLKSSFQRLWRSSPLMTGYGVSMLILAALLIPLIALDPTLVDGQLRWIKPTKFAVSLGLYSLTVAWILSYVEASRIKRTVASIVTAAGIIEIVLIGAQAARGRTSHFNNDTTLDGAIFTIMGVSIGIFFIANLVALVLAWRSHHTDRVLATGLRLGLAVASVGMIEAALMVGPTAEQRVELENGRQPARIGSHSSGAGGDLRVPHFVGMHALQVLPVAALLIRRRKRGTEEQKIRLVKTAAAAHLGLIVVLTWQALRGQPVLAPDAATLGALTALVFATCLAWIAIDHRPAAARFAEVVR